MNKLFESYDINYDLQGTKYIFKNPNKLFEDNLEYKFGSQYSRVFMNNMVDTDLYGKVMLFKNKLSNKEWQDVINEYGYDMMENYNLNFKFNEGVICIYIPAFEYETIKDLFQKFSLKFNMTLYYKLDHQTLYNIKYDDKNYIYQSNKLDQVCLETLEGVIKTLDINIKDNDLFNIDNYLEKNYLKMEM